MAESAGLGWVATDPEQKIVLSRYSGYHDNSPIEYITTYRQFFNSLQQPDKDRRSKEGEAFMTGACKGLRSGRNLAQVVLAVYDADKSVDEKGREVEGAPPPKQVHEALTAWNISHCIYTTFSHGEKGNRYRIVFPAQLDSKHELRAFQTYVTELLQVHAKLPIALVPESYAWGQGWNMPRVAHRDAPFFSAVHFGFTPSAKDLAGIYDFRPDGPRMPPVLHAGELAANSPIGVVCQYLPMQELLLGAGYEFVSQSTMLNHEGKETLVYRYRKPGSDSPPGVIVFMSGGRWRCYSHHSSDPLNNGHANDAFDAFRLLNGIQDSQQAMIAVLPLVHELINEELNSKHPTVMEAGIKLRYGNTYVDDVGGESYRWMDQTAFIQMMKNQPGVPIVATDSENTNTVKMEGRAEYWINNRNRINYNGLTFSPPHILHKPLASIYRGGKPYFNTFHAWPIKPYRGVWPLLEWHIREAICGGNEDEYEYFCNWVAHLIQRPAEKPGISVVLQGPRGAGKTLVMSALAQKLAPYSFVAGNNSQLVGNFNSHLRNKLLLVVEESFWAGSHRDKGTLQHLITDHLTSYEKKGFDSESGVSYLRVSMITNDDWAVPASAADERRYFLPSICEAAIARDTKDGRKGFFFPKLASEMQSGGLEAFLWDMAHRDLSEVSLRTIPATQKLADQKMLSLDWLDNWIHDALQSGVIAVKDDKIPWTQHGCRISMSRLKDSLNDAAPNYSAFKERSALTLFSLRFKKLFGEIPFTRSGGIGGTDYVFYSIDLYRQQFETYVKIPISWPLSKANVTPVVRGGSYERSSYQSGRS